MSVMVDIVITITIQVKAFRFMSEKIVLLFYGMIDMIDRLDLREEE